MGDLIGEKLNKGLKYFDNISFRSVLNADINPSSKLRIISDMHRVNVLYMIAKAGSGHLGSSFSSMELFTTLAYRSIVEPSFPKAIYFSSKGHDAPALYANLISLGILAEGNIHKLRQIDGLPGHPTVDVTGIVFNTGSLGMGISKAKGLLLGRYIAEKPHVPVVVITGDGELQEGQNWEALLSVSGDPRYRGLTIVVDHNKFQSDFSVESTSSLGNLRAKFEGFDIPCIFCDGNNIDEVAEALLTSFDSGRPMVVVAHTVKGSGVSFMEHTSMDSDVENMYEYHSGAPSERNYIDALTQIVSRISANTAQTNLAEELTLKDIPPSRPESAQLPGPQESLVRHYGRSLIRLKREYDSIVAMDADLSKDNGLLEFRHKFPGSFIQCGIAEQDMVSQASGIAESGLVPFVHSFACFLSSRANEQIFNNCLENRKICYVGTLAGLLPGGPGSSHQGIRDVSLMASMPNLLIYHPSDPSQMTECMKWFISGRYSHSLYLRLSSLNYSFGTDKQSSRFVPPGQGYVHKQGVDILVVTHGPQLIDTLLYKVIETLESKGVSIGVVEHAWLNRLDFTWFERTFEQTKKIAVIEDVYSSGSISQQYSEAISSSTLPLRLRSLFLEGIPACGSNQQVLDAHQLTSSHIIEWLDSYARS